MKKPTPDLPQASDAAATVSIAAAPKASASAKKKAAKTAATTATSATPKPAKKLAAKAVTASVVANTPHLPPEAAGTSTVTVVKTAKPKKAKLVRDSFTMPESEYNLIAEVKRRCLARGEPIKKSEVLRAAIIAFAGQPDASIGAALQALEIIKTGRPPKH